MITPDGDVKLLDMGLARALDDETGLTRANTVLGTLDYASPEQLRDAAKADVRSDLYSVGCTLYFALAGRAPFEGGDMINKIFKQRMEDPEPLENVARDGAGGVCRGRPQADEQGTRRSGIKTAPSSRRPDALDRPGPRARRSSGAEADAARSFRPPPPELVEEDLRLLDRDDPDQPRQPLPPRPRRGRAIHGPPPPGSHASTHRHRSARPEPRSHHHRDIGPQSTDDDSRWLVQFAIVAAVAGLIAIILIAIFLRF